MRLKLALLDLERPNLLMSFSTLRSVWFRSVGDDWVGEGRIHVWVGDIKLREEDARLVWGCLGGDWVFGLYGLACLIARRLHTENKTKKGLQNRSETKTALPPPPPKNWIVEGENRMYPALLLVTVAHSTAEVSAEFAESAGGLATASVASDGAHEPLELGSQAASGSGKGEGRQG